MKKCKQKIKYNPSIFDFCPVKVVSIDEYRNMRPSNLTGISRCFYQNKEAVR